jgi:hypothetical protein
MKQLIQLLIALLGICSVQAQVYSSNVVGYVNTPFGVGDTLFSNPMQSANNNLSALFSALLVPNGTTVSLWNPVTSTYDTSSTFNAGVWSVNLTLDPGTGAQLTTSSAFINTFAGYMLNHDGSLFFSTFSPPPLFSGPAGIYLLADKAPIADTGNDIFLNLIGRAPNSGEQVITLSGTYTYLGGGVWDTTPTLGFGQAAFLNLGPIPEPAATGLVVLGFGIILSWRRRSR